MICRTHNLSRWGALKLKVRIWNGRRVFTENRLRTGDSEVREAATLSGGSMDGRQHLDRDPSEIFLAGDA